MTVPEEKEVWIYDDNGEFERRVNEIFKAKWQRAIEAGSLITCTMSDQIRREAIKQVRDEWKAEHGGCLPF